MHHGSGAGLPREAVGGQAGAAGSVEPRSVHLWPELIEAGWQPMPSLLIVRDVYNAEEER
jgi:hypothetical protein